MIPPLFTQNLQKHHLIGVHDRGRDAHVLQRGTGEDSRPVTPARPTSAAGVSPDGAEPTMTGRTR